MNEIETPWEARRLKYLFDYSLSSIDRHVDPEQTPVKVCHYPFVYNNERLTQTLDFPAGTCTQEEYKRFRLFRGDILITKDSESPLDIGVPALVVEDLDNIVCGYHLGVLRSRTTVDTGYFFRFLQSDFVKGYFYCEASGITRYGLGKDAVLNLQLPLPPLQEQRLISRYLDKKTQQIDTLIEKIEKKIELLKEQRTSLINHYVTKGLDPNVEMKDSGVEWIGKIPKHWELKKLKHIVGDSGLIRGPFGGALKIETFKPSGFKVYEQKNAIYSDLSLGGSYVDEKKFRELSRFQVHSGDILMSCSGTIGKTTLIPQQFEEGIINQALLIIRIENPDLTEPQYIQKLFSSWFFQEQVIDNSQGGAMKNLVGIDVFKNVTLPLPPSQEQKKVLMTITTESLLIDELISKERRRRDLLTEYRQALISSVVTGKIRVTEDMV